MEVVFLASQGYAYTLSSDGCQWIYIPQGSNFSSLTGAEGQPPKSDSSKLLPSVYSEWMSKRGVGN